MSDAIKKSIKQGIETLLVIVVSYVITFFTEQLAPQLPQTQLLGVLVVLLQGVAKYLRASPNVGVPDYVNK